MPPVLLAAAAIVGSTSLWVGAAVIVAAAVTLSSVAYSAYMMASMHNPQQPDAATRLQTVRSSVQPHRCVYGECMTGGVLVYAVSHQTDPVTGLQFPQANEFISLVVAFTGHQIDAIEEVWLDDRESSDSSFARYIPAQAAQGYYDPKGNWIVTRPAVAAFTSSYVTITKYLGTPDQVSDPFLCGLSPVPSTFITNSPSSGLNDLEIINKPGLPAGVIVGTFTGVGVAVYDIQITAVGPTTPIPVGQPGDTFTWTQTLYAGDGSIINNAASGTHTILGGTTSILLNDGIIINFPSSNGHSVGQQWEIRAFDGSPWTANCTLTNRSYVVVTLGQSSTAFPNGLPNIKALIRGNNQIYDPRTGTTGYTNNAALCIRDYLAKPYGLNTPPAGINDTVSIAAANICDEQILLANGTYQPNYTMNGSFTLDKSPTAIMNEMLATFYGARAWTQGQYRILPAAYYAPVMTFYGMNPLIPGLTESDLRGPVKFRPAVSMKDKFNTVTGTFISTETWQPIDFPKVTNLDYVAQDGQEIVKDIQLTYVTDQTQAQRVAKIMLEKSRIAQIMEFPGKWSAFPLAIGDNVPVSISKLGQSQVIFTVINWSMAAEDGVDLTLQLDDPECYAWDSGQQTTIDISQFTILPDPRYVAAPTNVTPSIRRVDTNSGATARIDLVVVWTAGDPNPVRYQAQYQDPTTLQWLSAPDTSDTIVTFSGLAEGSYNVQVRAINTIGATSAWAGTSQYVPNPDETVPNVTGLEIFGQGNNTVFTGKDVKLDWNKVNPLVNSGTTDLSSPMKPDAWFRYYEVKISTSLGVLLRTEQVITEAYTYTFESNYADTSGTPERDLHIEVRAVATWGDESPVAATLDVTNPPPAQVSGFSATAYIMGIGAGWTPNTETDLAGYRLHAVSASELVAGSFTPSASNMINNGPESSFYYSVPSAGEWALMVAAYDTFGPTELIYSALVTVIVPTLAALNTVPPDVPIELTLTSAFITSAGNFSANITAAWAEDTTGAIPYNNGVVRIKPTSSSTWATYIVAKGLNAFTFTALVPGVSYDVQVAASDAYQNVSAFSATDSITAAGNTNAPDTVATPTLLFSFKNMYLNWANVSQTDIKWYEIQYSQDATFATGVTDATVPPTGGLTSFPVSASVVYYVRIRATNYSGLSGSWSTVVSGSTALIGASDVITTGALITETAQINDATITNAKIVSVSASKMTSGTVGVGTTLTIGAELTDGAYPITINSDVGGVSDIEINDGTNVRVRLGTLPTSDIGAIIYDTTGAAVLKVDSTGAVIQNLTGGTIDADLVTINNLVVGTNVTMGAGARISWSQVTSQPTILASSDVTTITENTVTT
ncbi:MAG: hypothetical protein ABSA86_13135, partial [Oryzomonas sp.]